MTKYKFNVHIPSPQINVTSEKEENVCFGFSDLQELSYCEAENDSKFFITFLSRLKKYCELTWQQIYSTHKHGIGGSETLQINELSAKARNKIPAGIDKLLVLRTDGANHPFLGYRKGNVFQVVFIEYTFGDIYFHGKKK